MNIKLLVLNGPNLNLLGLREPGIYGNITLRDIEDNCQKLAQQHACELDFVQENAEHRLVEHIHAALDKYQFIIINPAAFTHTSVALRDALLGVKIPFIELHLSNVHAREPFRQHSYFSDVAVGVMAGFGAKGYELALLAAIHHLQQKQ